MSEEIKGLFDDYLELINKGYQSNDTIKATLFIDDNINPPAPVGLSTGYASAKENWHAPIAEPGNMNEMVSLMAEALDIVSGWYGGNTVAEIVRVVKLRMKEKDELIELLSETISSLTEQMVGDSPTDEDDDGRSSC